MMNTRTWAKMVDDATGWPVLLGRAYLGWLWAPMDMESGGCLGV